MTETGRNWLSGTPDLLDKQRRIWTYLPGCGLYRHGAHDAMDTQRRSREEIEAEAGPVMELLDREAGGWKRDARVEWNPTEDRRLPGTVVIPGERNVCIWLDEGEFLWVLSSNLRHAEDEKGGPIMTVVDLEDRVESGEGKAYLAVIEALHDTLGSHCPVDVLADAADRVCDALEELGQQQEPATLGELQDRADAVAAAARARLAAS